MKQAEESATASALSGGRETRASITCNIELLGHFCASDPEQMDGETVGRRYPEVSWLIHTTSMGGRSEEKRKSGLRIPVENMAKSLSEVQSPVSRNSWKEAHFKPVLKKEESRKKCSAGGDVAPQGSLEQHVQTVQYFQMCLQLCPALRVFFFPAPPLQEKKMQHQQMFSNSSSTFYWAGRGFSNRIQE